MKPKVQKIGRNRYVAIVRDWCKCCVVRHYGDRHQCFRFAKASERWHHYYITNLPNSVSARCEW